MKTILIRICLVLFFRWLSKKKKDGENNILVNNIISANSVDDIMNIVTDDTTEETINEIIDDVVNSAKESENTILDVVFEWLMESRKYKS